MKFANINFEINKHNSKLLKEMSQHSHMLKQIESDFANQQEIMQQIPLVADLFSDQIDNISSIKSYLKLLRDMKINTIVIIADDQASLLAKAIFEIFFGKYSNRKPQFELIFIDNSISSENLVGELLNVKDKIYAINYISKSGIAVDTGIAFREFRQKLIDKLNKDGYDSKFVNRLIYITTDNQDNVLNSLVKLHYYPKFSISPNSSLVYNAYNAITIFTLLAYGVDIDDYLEYSKRLYNEFINTKYSNNPIYQYALARYVLCDKLNYSNEFLIVKQFELLSLGEWAQMLLTQTKNKNTNALITQAFLNDNDFKNKQWNTGQENFIFKTYINNSEFDNLQFSEFIKGYDILEFTRSRKEDVKKQLQNIDIADESNLLELQINIERFDLHNIIDLIFFIQFSSIISAMLRGVDPFNQPGIHVYKRNFYNITLK
ncbi:hypothetical protein H9M94_00805 [Mycoplasma sp. Pen4]|uniref:hypothetical protein n=1 Tax=Mycoplasma sp. Pen4 TaxID=640330 RepID=UPI001654546F|nr:hypothetical protein [Mycoplasma sp. Pen4]QNM93801.1 hypothetical protein H9M94_00805 [Mycoplasma sp. Pen4]